LIGDNSRPQDLKISYDAKNLSLAMPDIFNWLSGKPS
jgi:hypothetical protein